MIQDEDQEWFDEDGTQNENGYYDAGGHFYAERVAGAVDDYIDRMKDKGI